MRQAQVLSRSTPRWLQAAGCEESGVVTCVIGSGPGAEVLRKTGLILLTSKTDLSSLVERIEASHDGVLES